MIEGCKKEAPRAVSFISALLEPYDTSRLDWFRLYLRDKIQGGYAGQCQYPKRLKPRSRTWKDWEHMAGALGGQVRELKSELHTVLSALSNLRGLTDPESIERGLGPVCAGAAS